MSPGFLLSFLKQISRSNRARQTAVLYVSLVATLVLGIAVSIINTRLLGPQAFGDFKFLQTVWTLGVAFVTFGLFMTGANLLARQDSPETERPLMGSLLVIACAVSLLFTVAMALASFPVGQVYGQELGGKMRLFSALVFVFPVQNYLQEVLRGTNDVTSLALLNALPQLLYIPAALGISRLTGFSLDMALLLYLLSLLVTAFVVIIRARPSFNRVQRGIQEVMENNRAIGMHIYVAILVTTATTQLSQFSLAYFFDTRLVGMFSLALTITMPLTMIPNAISTTFFKQFATLDRIPRKVIVGAVTISVVTLLAFLAAIKEVILFLYTDKFIEVVPLAYICAVGAVLHGIGDVYSRYLQVHGKTMALRNNAVQLGVISVVGYVFLVAWWGVSGAAVTKFLVDAVYLATMLLYYGKGRALEDIK